MPAADVVPTPDAAPPVVSARGLSRTYQVGESEIHALEELDLDVAAGEFLGVVGVSGSGKSTLLHLVGGLDRPTAGEIVVAGRSLATLSRRQQAYFRRQTVGFIFQSFHLVPTLTALGNLELALTLQGIYGKRREELSLAALDQVGLADRAAHRPGQLSVGQQQRVAVARALLHDPPLLLADEPTANLDRATGRQLMELLADVRRRRDSTVLMVTHDEPLARAYCTRIVSLADGRLAGDERLVPAEVP